MNFANLHIVFSCMAAFEHNLIYADWNLANYQSLYLVILQIWLSLFHCYMFLIYVLFDSPFFIHNNILKLIRIGYHVIVLKPIYRWFWRWLFRFLQATAMLLLSAKSCKSEFVSHKNNSFIKTENRIGPSIIVLKLVVHPKVIYEKTRYIINFHTLLSILLVIMEKRYCVKI